MSSAEVDPLPRCCESHADWRTLAAHLVDDFTELPAGDVVREIGRAKRATESFELEVAEQIGVAELMARHQLMLLSGRLVDSARLDPERHMRDSLQT
jgi:hypothetical protein